MSCFSKEVSSREVSILGLKARGFLIKICSLACKRSSSLDGTLQQPLQAQWAPQNLLLAKHSQYSLRHLELLQLQDFKVLSGITDKLSGGILLLRSVLDSLDS